VASQLPSEPFPHINYPVPGIEFEEGLDRKFYIDLDTCIDCGACELVCPVEAIYPEFDLSSGWELYADIDALWFRDKEAARAKVAATKDNVRFLTAETHRLDRKPVWQPPCVYRYYTWR
jgi:ferredoxin